MARQLGRRVILLSVVIGAIIIVVKLASMGRKPQTKLVSSILSVPIDAATAPFDVHLWSGHIRGSVPSSERAAYFLALVVHEYSIYPPEFFRATGLERIVLCSELTFESQVRGALPDFDHSILYLDVDQGSYDQFYQRRVLHHELFHVVDWRDDGQLYKDEKWRELNSDSFRYGEGGIASQPDNLAGNLQASEPGFLTSYSMSGVEEDKAELFSFLILSPKLVHHRAEKDMVLTSKVARMKELLIDFCPQLGDSFWRKVEATDRGTGTEPATQFIPIDNP